jgi:hypothetical protein
MALISKTSKYGAPEPLKYYKSKEQIKANGSMALASEGSFDSQVNPNILPGELFVPQDNTSFLVSELDEFLITEDNNNIIL